MSFVSQEINLIATSATNAGAINKSADGSAFEIQLEDALAIPKEATNITIAVESATIWWVVPNIITGQNDRMYITAPDTLNVLTAYVVVIPQGLYDLSGLNQAILRELQNQGAKISPSPVLTFTPDDATQKVEVIFNYIGVEIDFTQADTPRDILGWGSQIVGPNVAAPATFLAPNVAAFNQVNYFLIHSDLVSKGIRFNNNYNQTIAQVLIDVPPGSQIVSTPFNPAKADASELGGAKRTNIRFNLTDDQNRPVNTNGEDWTARVVIKYFVPHIFRTADGRYV